MRVAFLTPDVTPTYGWGRYAAELASALHHHGAQIVALTQSGGAPAHADQPFAAIHPILPGLVPPRRGFLLRSLLAAVRVRRATRGCDVVHVIAEPYVLLGYAAAGTRPLVVTAHGTYIPQTVQRAFVGNLYRRAYRHARLVAVSQYTAEQVRRALPGSAPVVIHNGVNVAHFQQPAPAPHKLGPTILAAGGVKARKGTHVLVEALAQVRATVPDAQLVVTGSTSDSAYVREVQARIHALNLDSAVHLVGRVSDEALRGWYQHADVFALPALNVGSSFEGFGLVFLEAGACGLPVVGTTGSGAAEAIRDNETGLLVPQHDASALAAALTRLLTDETLRQQMGAAGRTYAASQDWAQIAARVLTFYA